jgi:hypothetical protein
MEKDSTNEIKGWSCGDITLKDNHLDFSVGNKSLFQVPYKHIDNVLQPNKNEIAFEFNQDEGGNKYFSK